MLAPHAELQPVLADHCSEVCSTAVKLARVQIGGKQEGGPEPDTVARRVAVRENKVFSENILKDCVNTNFCIGVNILI